ncbi:hypothetical protein BJY52DRAFT_163143 [Lactarius psammicola]|nr:hypothetical protein BJY52DRAFT_163143 [Lactarius psammicola]
MSRDPLESVNITETNIGLGAGGGNHQYPPQSAPTQAPQGMSNFVDGSGPIFSMYLEMATEEDKKMVEGWKADADGILIFTGLFSAAVASLISVSIQDIRPNPQDTSNFYLANIYQTLADPNQSNISSSLPAPPLPFNAPNSAVWVNALWFLSLVISLTCALLATLLQQWARRYLKVTQPRYSPHKRARIRAFFFEGVDKLLLPWAVEALPTLLHVSLFLFFTGLVVFLCNVNLTIFKLVLSWVGACTTLYGCITFMPIFRHDSPYHTPLSLPAWHIVAGISFVTFRVLQWFIISTFFCFPCFCFGPISLSHIAEKAHHRFRSLEKRKRKILLQGMQRTVEESALNSPSDIDTRAFLWTLSTLDEDHEVERFFSGLPGFRCSKVVKDPLPSLTEEQKEKISTALMGLLDVTFSSNLLPEPVKDRRAIICAKAFDPAHIPRAFDVFDKILSRYQYSGPMSAEIVRIMSGWGKNRENNSSLVAAVCMAVARVPRRDDSWFILASDGLGVPESVLRDYAAYGGSLLLAVLIHVTRQQFIHFWTGSWPWPRLLNALMAASKFDAQDTSPELQHEFCALWNQIVLKVKNDYDRFMALHTLGPIRHIYIALHQGTNAAPTRFSASTGDWDDILREPSSYPVCNVAGHIHDDSSSTTTVLRDNAALIPASPTSPEAPSSFVPAPLHVIENLTHVPPLDNFHSAHQTTIQSLRIPVTSPGPATTGAIRDIITSDIILPHPTTETSAFAPPFPSAFAAAAPQRNPDPLTPSNPPNLPSSTSHPVLDDILPTESYRSIVVTTAPSTSPGPTSAPDLDSAAEDHGSPKPEFHKKEDALDPHSVNWEIHANTITTRGLPPQTPSMPLVTNSDVAIAGPSLREPNAERTGDSPVDPSHGLYDIV